MDAWEIANRNNIFNDIGLKRLPFIANSDFHKPKHIYSWKTLIHCEKDCRSHQGLHPPQRARRHHALSRFRRRGAQSRPSQLRFPGRRRPSFPGPAAAARRQFVSQPGAPASCRRVLQFNSRHAGSETGAPPLAPKPKHSPPAPRRRGRAGCRSTSLTRKPAWERRPPARLEAAVMLKLAGRMPALPGIAA